jgi:hypothetical protein
MKSTPPSGLARVIYVVMLLVALVQSLSAQTKDHQESLAKLHGVKVTASTPTNDDLRTPEKTVIEAVTGLLKEAGIKVFSENEFSSDKAQPVLHVSYFSTKWSQEGDFIDAHGRKTDNRYLGVFFTIEITLTQNVTLSDGRKSRAATMYGSF